MPLRKANVYGDRRSDAYTSREMDDRISKEHAVGIREIVKLASINRRESADRDRIQTTLDAATTDSHRRILEKQLESVHNAIEERTEEIKETFRNIWETANESDRTKIRARIEEKEVEFADLTDEGDASESDTEDDGEDAPAIAA